MSEIENFKREVQSNISNLANDKMLKSLSHLWLRDSAVHKYSYNFRWMNRPAIMLPNDAWAMQEIIFDVKPDLIIEAGIAHGGSLIFYASMLALLDLQDSIQEQTNQVNINEKKRKVLGLDIDIRKHNREEIEKHPMCGWIEMIEGSSIDPTIIEEVVTVAKSYEKILVVLDSNHTHDHVLSELRAFAPLVTPGSYCVVFDTILEDMPADQHPDRPWSPGNSPKTAVWEFLTENSDFVVEKDICEKLQITVAPEGFLKKKL